MKKLILGMVAALGLSAAAQAATFNINVAASVFNSSSNAAGMQMRAWVPSMSGPLKFTNATYSNTLGLGGSTTRNVFNIIHFDAPLQADDVIPKPISVTFTTAFGAGTIGGTTFAVATDTIGTNKGYGKADFDATVLDFWTGAGHLLISLADTTFGSKNGVFTNGKPYQGKVIATYSYVATIPLPAALPMGMGALGLMGFISRRRKAKTA